MCLTRRRKRSGFDPADTFTAREIKSVGSGAPQTRHGALSLAELFSPFATSAGAVLALAQVSLRSNKSSPSKVSADF